MNFKIILDIVSMVALISAVVIYNIDVRKYEKLVKIESNRIDEEAKNLQEYQRKSEETLHSDKLILESINQQTLVGKKILNTAIRENKERVTAINKLDIPDYIHIDKDGSILAVKGDIAETVLTHEQVLGMFLIMKSLWGTSDVRSKD